jgi:hypothetical protein
LIRNAFARRARFFDPLQRQAEPQRESIAACADGDDPMPMSSLDARLLSLAFLCPLESSG